MHTKRNDNKKSRKRMKGKCWRTAGFQQQQQTQKQRENLFISTYSFLFKQ